MEEEKKGLSSKLKIILLIFSIIVVVALIICLIVFYSTPKKIVNKTKNGADVTLSYAEKNNVLTIKNATPLEDSIAIKDLSSDNYIEFSVDSELESASSLSYEVSIKRDESISTISDNDIKIYLEREVNGTYKEVLGPTSFKALSSKSKLGTAKGNMVLYKVTTTRSNYDNYRLKIWLSNAAVTDGTSQDYSVKVYVSGVAK